MSEFTDKVRARARENFLKLPYPHRKDEYWRFSDYSSWGEKSLEKYLSSFAEFGENGKADTPKVISSNPKVRVLSISDAAMTYPSDVERFFQPSAGKFAELQMCAPENSILIDIPENEESFIEIAHTGMGSISSCGAIIRIGANASVRIRRTFYGEWDSLATRRFSFELNKGCRLELSTVSDSRTDSPHYINDSFYCGSDSCIVDAYAERGAWASRTERVFEILGTGAKIDSRAFILSRGRVVHDLRTSQMHRVGGASSNVAVKSALFDESQLAFSGLIRVEEVAQKSDAYQSCKSLLMSNAARSQSSPALEILANDVICSHGCAVARPDEDELFYMRSRGLALQESRELILGGFSASVFEKITDRAFADKIATALIK